MSFFRLPELVDQAITYEEATQDFYERFAGRLPEGEIHALVLTLRDQERKHITQLTELKARLESGSILQNVGKLQFPIDLADAELAALSQSEALQMALRIENTGRDFYLLMAESASNPVIRDFFATLARFEAGHIEIINRQLAYS